MALPGNLRMGNGRMIFCISGAPGAGKTVLARAAADKLGYALVEVRSREALAARGFDLSLPMSRLRRVAAQELAMERLEAMLRTASVPTIVDRSPLDLVAGMLCEAGPQDSQGLSQRIMAYVDGCLDLARRYCHGIVVLRPFQDGTASPVNPAFQCHVQSIIESAATRLRRDILTHTIRKRRFEERVSEVVEVIDQEENEFRAELERERLAMH
jgi:hypothetical protein